MAIDRLIDLTPLLCHAFCGFGNEVYSLRTDLIFCVSVKLAVFVHVLHETGYASNQALLHIYMGIF